MKKLILLLMFILSTFTYAEDTNTVNDKAMNEACKKALELGDKEAIMKQGCCSWHGGVCGCSNGRTVCCDGTYSPSCTCKEATPIPETVENKG